MQIIVVTSEEVPSVTILAEEVPSVSVLETWSISLLIVNYVHATLKVLLRHELHETHTPSHFLLFQASSVIS